MHLLKKRIRHFVDIAMKNEYIYIFESVIFQQILNELVLYSDCTVDEMAAFILEIEKMIFEKLTIDKRQVFVGNMDYEIENQYIYNEVVK